MKLLKKSLFIASTAIISLMLVTGCSQPKESKQIPADKVDFNVKPIKSDNALVESMGELNDTALKANLNAVYMDIIVTNENKDDNLTTIGIPFTIDLLQEDDLKYTILDEAQIEFKSGEKKILLRDSMKSLSAHNSDVELNNTVSSENQIWIDIEGEHDPNELAKNISKVYVMLGDYQGLSDVTLVGSFNQE